MTPISAVSFPRRSVARLLATMLLTAACAAPPSDEPTVPPAGAALTTTSSNPSAADQPTDAASAGQALARAADSLPSLDTPNAHSGQTPNELGRIPVLEYHLVVDEDGTYAVSRDRFRAELETLYVRGYRPIGLSELLDKAIDLPRGQSPALFIFDDASPSQFRYIERDGGLHVDPTSALGIWLDFAKDKPDWRNRGLFCLLPGAAAGRSFFGDKDIEGQKTAWRFPKLRHLDSLGFELCNHTLWHARLDKYGDAMVQEQIARGELAIDSAMPGYRVRGFALPLGMWPNNRPLAWQGQWRDPKTGTVLRYQYDAVFEVAGGPARSPHDSLFNPRSIPRIPLGRGMPLYPTLRALENVGPGARYVSDGDPNTVARPGQ